MWMTLGLSDKWEMDVFTSGGSRADCGSGGMKGPRVIAAVETSLCVSMPE